MGTDAWENWRAFEAGANERENFDDELHSDGSFVGGPVTLGPFRLSTIVRGGGSVGPAALLQGGIHADLTPAVVVDGRLAPADSGAYHGGIASDEIAALISLALGVRIRLAGSRRLSGIRDGQGSNPSIYLEVRRLAHPGQPNREILPRAMTRPANLNELSRLESFPLTAEPAQVELVRAARSYATAMWWANEDANQAWLHLVTSVETAAKCRQMQAGEPLALIEELWPELWDVLLPADDAVREDVARLLAPQVRSTRTFVDFIDEAKPPPPDPRPEAGKVDWSRMRDHARLIYQHRSRALHSGKPFPLPMLQQPMIYDSGAIQETPLGLNTGGLGAIWDAAETPMLLSAFEHVARGALLFWWDELSG